MKIDPVTKYRMTHIASGLCRGCSERAVAGKRYCKKHLDEGRERVRKYRKECKDRGVCARCGNPMSSMDEGFVYHKKGTCWMYANRKPYNKV